MEAKPKSLVLLSGGLDSQLAVKVLQRAGCEVTGLTFTSPFFTSEKAEEAAKALGIKIIVKDITEIHFPIVQNPPHGYGKNMNPCVDCHGLMFNLAGKLAKKEGFDLIATGEVLGQRPFSQNKQALQTVKKIAGVEILRPLCAKHLPETSFEESGLIDREKLLDFQSKSRKPQIALAAELGITDYPAPAGGCLLTDPGYSARLKKLLERDPKATPEDVRLIRIGRFLPVGQKSFAMIGRDQAENKQLQALATPRVHPPGQPPGSTPRVHLVKMQNLAGPTALLRIKKPDSFEEVFSLVAQKVKGYGRDSKKHEGEISFKVWGKLEEMREV
jgi:tRNA-uridine 2-sulfurtransferase